MSQSNIDPEKQILYGAIKSVGKRVMNKCLICNQDVNEAGPHMLHAGAAGVSHFSCFRDNKDKLMLAVPRNVEGTPDVIARPDPLFTIVHINSHHRKMAMGISVVQAPDIASALQKLQIAASNKNETTEPLCAFAGRQENLLTLENSSMRPTQAPSKQIEIAREDDIPKEAANG